MRSSRFYVLLLFPLLLTACDKDSWDLFRGDPTIDGLPVVQVISAESTGDGEVKVEYTVSASENAGEVSFMGVCYSSQDPDPSILENQHLFEGKEGRFYPFFWL